MENIETANTCFSKGNKGLQPNFVLVDSGKRPRMCLSARGQLYSNSREIGDKFGQLGDRQYVTLNRITKNNFILFRVKGAKL